MATAKRYTDPREYIKFMLEHFRFERYFYLFATIISLVLLFYCVIILLKDPSKSIKSATTLLAPGGLIAGACYRILKIWNDCFKIVKDYLNRPLNDIQ
jgi:hypothetical protein